MRNINLIVLDFGFSVKESIQALEICPRHSLDMFDINQNILSSLGPGSNCGTLSLPFNNQVNALVGQVGISS